MTQTIKSLKCIKTISKNTVKYTLYNRFTFILFHINLILYYTIIINYNLKMHLTINKQKKNI